MNEFIEQDCTVEFQGRKFTSGGSHIVHCTDGYYRGVVYEDPEKRTVKTWHGQVIGPAHYGVAFRGNFCRMRYVTFSLDAVKFKGCYCPDTGQAIRVKSTTKSLVS